ncbi:2-succinyl-5-enolpyruvyl-6-hydroxy-3-cyclohexene-1-carboxylic-acid synthase [Companilactobacillus versmoldensis]|uniref:2-succinyl-5-enolpyruvyl-6-hydroxy-3- cyclohexene-1-carboxylic-acid synthase n=1 Tax=Companilactobacillus versmoldensis TaxID=194326 RepID=UPI0002491A4E|nr:2-succinyl-5-enolpyruvyl-6-hydroxy-3-cyclohexene-1-carboxylic-acid synthase [Companilactobacillus versmoldensis]
MTKALTQNIKIFLQSLIVSGIKDFVISPGSRSTPVVILLAEMAKNNDLNLFIDVDERSASFFGLGLSKKNRRPIALICTSGTAATEYASAIAEAKLSQVPLVVITTDRPMELSNIGAPQAIDQMKLYGSNTKDFVSFDLQTAVDTIKDYVTFETQRIVLAAQKRPIAPVQINLPFRKPLMPELNTEDPIVKKIAAINSETRLNQKFIDHLSGRKLVILAGPEVKDYHQELLALAQKQNIPVIADVLSNIRQNSPEVITNFDQIVKNYDLSENSDYRPDVVIRFGGTLVSAPTSRWLQAIESETEIINVANNGLADHTLSSNETVDIDELDLIEQLTIEGLTSEPQFTERLLKLSHQVANYQTRYLENDFSELMIPQILDEHLPEDANIFLSNSMPVRDFENFYQGKETRQIYCNRGANGIDGVVSTALGVSAFSSDNYLLIGDLALFHDMNGLMMAKRYDLSLTIIVINNNGGGIFSFLPQADAKEYFEQLFGTPQDIDFDQVAKLYGFDYYQATDQAELIASLSTPKHQKIIEVTSDRIKNLQDHRDFDAGLKKELNNYVKNNH